MLSGESVEMSFNVKEFVAHPLKWELDSLLKTQLRQVVQHLKIAVDNEEKAKKAELKHAVLDHFVEEDLLSDEDFSGVGNEVEIKWLELEHHAREQEKNRECQLKIKELELEERERMN